MGRLREFISSSHVHNVAKLLSANVIAQVIGLIVYPILTRIYAPEDFGLLNLFLSIGGVLGLLSIAEYQYAIVLPKEDHAAISILQIGFYLLIISTAIIGFSVIFSDSIAGLFNSPNLASYYWLMPIYVFVIGIWNLLNYWYIRQKQYNNISTYQLSQSIASSSGKLLFGYAGILSGGMIYSTLIAPIVSIVLVCSKGFRQYIRPLFRLYNIRDLFRQGIRYKNFPMFVLPRSLINTIGGNLPVLLLTPYFGLAEIGFFGMAFTLSFRPINLACSSIYQVLYQKISNNVNAKEHILPFIRNYLLKSGVIVAIGFIALYFILPWIVNWLLGSDWIGVSAYIRVMLPWLLLIFLNTSLSFLPDVFKKQHIYLYFEIAYIICRILALIIGILLKSIHTAILLYSLVGAFILFIELCWFISMVIKYERDNK